MAKANKKKEIVTKYRLLDDTAPFAVKEAYGMLRTNILYMPCEDNEARIIAITSAEEGSGKSTILANLALSFSRTSKRVVVIDADMRCPRQHRFFKYDKNTSGLSEYLAGMCARDEVVKKNAYENLDIIPCGHIPPSPAELVLSSKFAQLMNELKNEYDFVFIDFPPIGIVSDAAAVAKYVTGYLFVVRSGHSDMTFVRESIEQLEQVDANILGLIFNDINFKESSYGKNYYNGKYRRYEYSKYSHQPQSRSSKSAQQGDKRQL